MDYNACKKWCLAKRKELLSTNPKEANTYLEMYEVWVQKDPNKERLTDLENGGVRDLRSYLLRG